MYRGDINNFKMDMRAQLNLYEDKKSGKGKLCGYASVMKKTDDDQKQRRKKETTTKPSNKIGEKSASSKTALNSILEPKQRYNQESTDVFNVDDVRKTSPATEPTRMNINEDKGNEAASSIEPAQDDVPVRKKYVPPHIRNKNYFHFSGSKMIKARRS